MDVRADIVRILVLSHGPASVGSTFARIITPLRAMERAGNARYAHVYLLPWQVATYRYVVANLAEWDVVWIARPEHWIVLPVMRSAQRLGIPVLVDIDDWLFDAPRDHLGVAHESRRAYRQTLSAALRAATAITVSTRSLAERCAAFGAPVHLIPNCVDCNAFTVQARLAPFVTVAFCGSASHADDLALVAPALRQLLHDRADSVRVVTVGCRAVALDGIPGYQHYDAVAGPDYAGFLSGLGIDIGLAPLLDTPFTAAKSDIKYLEYSAVGAATIASPVRPYRDSIQEDRGVIAASNTPEAWAESMARLVENAALRRRLAQNARRWACGTRSSDAAGNTCGGIFMRYASGAPRGDGVMRLPEAQFRRSVLNLALHEWPYYRRVLPARAAQKIALQARRRGWLT